MKKLLSIQLLLVLLSGCSSKENEIKSFILQEQFIGTVLIAEGDDFHYADAFGYSNFEENRKNTLDTKFLIGSLTKAFTAACIMKIAEDGLLATTDPVIKYLSIPVPKAITIHNLLNHTSGIPDIILVLFLNKIDTKSHLTPMELLELISFDYIHEYNINKYDYSNSNYLLLGLIIEEITGKTFGEYLEENIFIPADMTNSGTSNRNYLEIENIAMGYKNASYERDVDYSLSIPYSYGGIYSTVEDLYKWYQFLQSDFLSEKSKLAMFSSQTDGNSMSYGYGWQIQEDQHAILHNGLIDGFASEIFIQQEMDRVIIILSNTTSAGKSQNMAIVVKTLMILDDTQ